MGGATPSGLAGSRRGVHLSRSPAHSPRLRLTFNGLRSQPMTSSRASRSVRTGLATVLLLVAPGGAGLAQVAEEVRCSYTRRMACSTEGCESNDVGSTYLVVPPLQALRDAVANATPIEIRRCDPQGCTPVRITQAAGGGFLTLSGQSGAYLIKIYAGPTIDGIELRTGDFTEVVTSMMTTFVAYGHCAEAQR